MLAAKIPEDSDWRYYHHYNMGARWLPPASGMWRPGTSGSSTTRAATAKRKSLRDRAYTASGYAQMAAGQLRRRP